MRSRFKKSILLVTLISAAAFAGERQDSSSDFDLFLSKFGGKIPFPPQTIVERLGEESPPSSPVVAELLAHGRSLERRYTNYEYPRAVVAWAPKGDQQPAFFFAYTPKKKQLEVISYNWKTGKNEFRIVSNYGPGLAPKVEQPPQGACLACHQGGEAIFPEFPWSEASQGESATRLVRRAKDPFAKYLLQNYNDGLFPKNKYLPFKLDPENFQNRKDQSNAAVETRSVCPKLCGSDLECRTTLFSAMAFGQRYRGWRELEVMSALRPETKIPNLGKFSFPDSTLLDREGFELGLDPDAGNDPLIPRDAIETEIPLPEAVRSCSPQISSSVRERIEHFKPGALKAALTSEEFRAFLAKNWLPDLSWDRAIDLLERVRPGRTPVVLAAKTDCLTGMEKVRPITDATATLFGSLQTEVARTAPMPPTALAIRYCATCHYGDGSIAPTLPLLDLSQMKRYVGGTGQRTPEFLLKSKIMPPEGAEQPTDDERKLLIDAIRSAK